MKNNMFDIPRETLVKQIFSDAHVIDIDFSVWDKKISVYAIADHVAVPPPRWLPVYAVVFLRTRLFKCDFHHLHVTLDRPSDHFQWRIDDFSITEESGSWRFILFCDRTSPKIEVECEDFCVRHIPNSVIDKLFPGWRKPSSGLARPGIEALSRSLYKGK